MRSFPEIIYLSLSKEYLSKYWAYVHTVDKCPFSRKLLEIFPIAEISVYRTMCYVTLRDIQVEYKLNTSLKQECKRWGDYNTKPGEGVAGWVTLHRISYLGGVC